MLRAADPRPAETLAGWLVAAMAVFVALLAVEVLLHPLPVAVSELFQKFASCAVCFGAAGACAARARHSRDASAAWWLLALGIGLWGMGAGYYAVFLWDREVVPVPSIADGFWLAFYLPTYAALYLLMRRQAGRFRPGARLDAVIGGLGVGGAAAALVFEKTLQEASGPAAAVATNLAYPIGDLGLLAFVVAAVTVTGWRRAGLWRFIGPAFALFVVADSIFLIAVANGTYETGGLVDLGWPAAALLLAVAAWRPAIDVTSAPRATTGMAMPAVFGLAALALLVIDHFHPTNLLALGLATATLTLILVRMLLTAIENARLLASSRREATTDPLTGLRNRRQLTADLADHVARLDPERPLKLTLFDLDGFKQYNDTFGHVAGDRLLQRLATRLDAGRTATAYRIGGDEFCTLERPSDHGETAFTTDDAVAALSERGDAFSIEASHGSVLLPRETADQSEALRLADRRMYDRKATGRTSAANQSADVLLRALGERGSELSAHLGGVADLACATAELLGVTERDLEASRQTALLHDVGKMAIPDAILRKPGPLDEDEWAFMKRHTIIGERIISGAPALAHVAAYVRSTHERYDGGGYPDGLAGEAIPLVARIVAVCGAYDAMTTRGPVRDARDPSEALGELRRCAGAQFDPRVVEAFAAALGQTQEPTLA